MFGLLTLSLAAPCRADDVSGGVSGYVIDDRGIPIKNVTVIADTAGELTVRRVTDRNGFFSFLPLLPGRWFVTAEPSPRYQLCYTIVSVIPGIVTRLDFRLPAFRPDFLDHCHHITPNEALIF